MIKNMGIHNISTDPYSVCPKLHYFLYHRLHPELGGGALCRSVARIPP